MTTTITGTYVGYTGAPGYPGGGVYSYGFYAFSGGPGGFGGAGYETTGGTIAVTGSVTGGQGGLGGAGYGFGGGYGGAGGPGLDVEGAATITNSGAITGGAGGAGGPGAYSGAGGFGGTGLAAEGPATITNTGTITGGAGGIGGYYTAGVVLGAGGFGGAGLVMYAGGSLANSGLIRGGQGGSGVGAYGGNGGDGVDVLAGGSVANTGTIKGGAGGASASGGYAVNGDGVFFYAGGTLKNGAPGDATATIAGYRGVVGYGSSPVTVMNYGVIQGYGTNAVQFYSANDTFVAEPGSSVIGQVVGGAGAMVIAGGQGTITGMGGAGSLSGSIKGGFTGFNFYQVAAGSWTLSGANTLSAGKVLRVDGTLSMAPGATLDNEGKLRVGGGRIDFGGAVTGGGRVKLDGGSATFGAGFEENFKFTGPAGFLVLADSRDYSGSIKGLSTTGGTSLDLLDIGFVSSGEASFSGTASGGTLTVSDGTHTAQINLVGDYLSSSFVASSDGHGGVIIVDPPAKTAPARAAAASFTSSMAGLVESGAALASQGQVARAGAYRLSLVAR